MSNINKSDNTLSNSKRKTEEKKNISKTNLNQNANELSLP